MQQTLSFNLQRLHKSISAPFQLSVVKDAPHSKAMGAAGLGLQPLGVGSAYLYSRTAAPSSLYVGRQSL